LSGYCQIRIAKNQEVLAGKVQIASSFYDRLLGLMFCKDLKKKGDALLLTSCNSIHTCFMRFSIDVVFISKNNEVVKIIKSIPPWRMTWLYWRASSVLEMEANTLNQSLKVGDKVDIICLK
jgi:hypothetical protein